MTTPKKLEVEKPVKMVFAGGFLGAGKTTALAGLGKLMIERGMRVGLITNDQSHNLVDTVIARQMLSELGVPIEEVVKGCFCCRFDELIDHIEKILEHKPDVLLGEPVGSCTDFVAAVANPIKIHYHEAFRFAPFSIMVDPVRVREMLLGENQTSFPEEVSYLFQKQLEEADIVVLNKTDLLSDDEKERLVSVLADQFSEKSVAAVSAKHGNGMDEWLEDLLSGRPGANTVLRQIDYDRYATAEAVLGWLNAAAALTSNEPFDTRAFGVALSEKLRDVFRAENAEIGHLKFIITSAGKAMWVNITHLADDPSVSGDSLGGLSKASLILNARVRIEPEQLEKIVERALETVAESFDIKPEIMELQCFSPAYPAPPYLMREQVD